jgi:hypothetical protein
MSNQPISTCNRQQQHNLIVIQRMRISAYEESVVRWCAGCGAVAVDLDVDGRTDPGHFMRMRFPHDLRQGTKS